MKIAHIVLKTLPFGGGVERYVEEIGPRLAAAGHEIVVYTMAHYGPPPSPYRGMRVIPVRAIGSSSAEKITCSWMATWNACLREKPDLVHYHALNHQFPFLPRFFGIPVLMQGHGIEWNRPRWGPLGRAVLRASERICVRSATRLVVVSKALQSYLQEKYGRDSAYIPTGINPPQRREPDLIKGKWGLQGRDYLLTVGRLVPEKGIHYLLEAFKGLPTGMKLVIAGEAVQGKAYGESLRRLASGDPRVVFAGYAEGALLQELMSNPYAFVLPSETEGLPTALLEAMSYGNCCLVSDIPGNLEALQGRGVTFQSCSVEDLREKLQGLIEDKVKTARFRSGSAQGLVEGYGWDGIADQFGRLYAQMVPGRGGKA